MNGGINLKVIATIQITKFLAYPNIIMRMDLIVCIECSETTKTISKILTPFESYLIIEKHKIYNNCDIIGKGVDMIEEI